MNFRALSSASLVLLLGVAPFAGCGSSTSSPSADAGTHADAGGDGTTHGGGGSCTTNADCMKKLPATTPANCATAMCNALEGTCTFAAKDQDGDGHTAANCKANGGSVTIVAGDDCNDDDANLYPGHAEACTKGEDGGTPAGVLCKQGVLTCLSDGSESPCTGSVYCVNQTCSNGMCQGSCATGETTCAANAVLTCAGGAWGAPSACTNQTCVGGEVDGGAPLADAGVATCKGTCAPGQTQCTGQQPQTCGADGAWTSTAAACTASMVCQAGMCVTECQIAGQTYIPGAQNPTNSCQTCQPDVSTSVWSSVGDGTSCGNGQVCNMGVCGTGCFIGDAGMVMSGAPDPTNVCQSCQPGTSTSMWSPIPAGTSCGTGSVCNSGTCAPGCGVGGMFYAPSALNPANSCQGCSPAMSTYAFSTLPDGTSCGAAEVCTGSTCTDGCFIAGKFYTSGTVNSASGAVCQVCNPQQSTTQWSIPTPAVCGGGGGTGVGACTSAGVCTVSFSVPVPSSFTVPAGVTQLTIMATGGAGAGHCPGATGTAGGLGGEVTATVAVTPGTALGVFVGAEGGCSQASGLAPPAPGNGGQGGSGYTQGAGTLNDTYGGGGGGGASAVLVGTSSVLVLAGGGGGVGGLYTAMAGTPNAGGAGGGTAITGAGGGGTLGGGAGTMTGGAGGSAPVGGNATAGGAGTLITAGTGGTSSTGNGGSGGGGGGAGYFGGGGGAGGNGLTLGGGGGGGSSYAEPAATMVTMTPGVQSGNGMITISY